MPEGTDRLTEIRDNIVAGVLVNPGSGISISDYAVNLSAVAGANSLNSSDPESDEAWIIEAIWAVNINTGEEITLPPGAFIKAYFWNCALNDDIYLYWHGYTVPLVA